MRPLPGHVQNIVEKLCVENRTQATRRIAELGLLTPDG